MLKKETFDSFLFKQIDNAPLIIFRILFGLLIFLESVGAIFTGWVKRAFIEPEFTFTFIGFEWMQPLPGYGMYVYYALMGVFGLLVMLGYKYRWSLGIFTVMWTVTYLMQKSSYNNHYYLLIIICLIMLLLPAHRYASLDVKQRPAIKSLSMPNWCRWIIILQLWIVYTYAAVAKLYPDWLDGSVAEILMASRASDYPVVGPLLQQKWTHFAIAYFGVFFDLLIIPLLLWKPSRKIAFGMAIFFHLFNSFILQIGIFPYLSLAFTLFFFEPETIRRIFLKRKTAAPPTPYKVPAAKKIFLGIGILYFIIQLALPLRHWFITDNVLWTEEGHRMSWRMMLRLKSGYISFKVVDKATGNVQLIRPQKYLSTKQLRAVGTKPDMIWQFAQHIKKMFKKDGKEVAVYAIGKIKVNKRPLKVLIDPEVDLASVKWSHFKHHEWILPSKQE